MVKFPECRFYMPPNGESVMSTISDIYDEDAAWFIDNNVKLSMEQLTTGDFACYADVGLMDEDGEPEEAIEISRGRDCKETMHALRVQAEGMLM